LKAIPIEIVGPFNPDYLKKYCRTQEDEDREEGYEESLYEAGREELEVTDYVK
jgi:hypothetical protein